MDAMTSPADSTVETAQVRRSPRFGAFMALGALLGVVVSLILTFVFDGTGEKSPFTGFEYSPAQVFGFVALICVPLGVALVGLLAVLLDRTVGRRTRDVRITHERVRSAVPSDPESEA